MGRVWGPGLHTSTVKLLEQTRVNVFFVQGLVPRRAFISMVLARCEGVDR